MVIVFAVIHAAAALGLTEIMYNPPGSDTGREWVEVLAEESINLSQAKFFDNEGNHGLSLKEGYGMLSPGDVAIITNDANKFLVDYPGFSGTLFQASFSLSNAGETIGISEHGAVMDQVTYTADLANGNGYTLEEKDGAWTESTVMGGTPGTVPGNEIPEFGPIAGTAALVGACAAFFLLRKN